MSARRRGGKPNRGGGRFNKPRGGGGRGVVGGNRKGGATRWDDGEDFSLAFGPSCSSRTGKGRGGGGRAGGRDGGRGEKGARDQDRDGKRDVKISVEALPRSLVSPRMYAKVSDGIKPEASNMPFQKIFMSNENQEQLKEFLRELRTQDFDELYDDSGSDYSRIEEEEEGEFDELDYREEGQFWATNDEPVEKAESPAFGPESEDEQPTPEPIISLFAIGKLCRYGFDRERSKQALESGGGEFGATLEQLLQQVFSECYGQKALSPDGLEEVPMDECMSQREEEALALAAIYGERFSERIANAVWTVTLDLSFLSGSSGKNGGGAGGGAENLREVCRFYMKGHGCRFGDKCRFKHRLPTKDRSMAGSSDLKGPGQPGISSYSPPEYELEVRFPKGNRYPFQAPVVAFSTNDESLGAAGRLSVTERLFGEALAAAKSSEPIVYTLINLCEDENTMRKLLAVRHHKYSTPPPVVVPPPSLAIAKSKSARSSASEESRSTSTSSSNHTNSKRTPTSNNQRTIETVDAEETDDRDEDEEDQAVPVENASYVNLRKMMVKRHNQKMGNVLRENSKLRQEFQRKQSSRHYSSMLEQRKTLPAWQEKENILDVLDQCQVLVISGMTGCGKTTQIPQFILDASLSSSTEQVANIICTQPRRISAMSVAQRVAQERAECLGNSVGYQIRLESVRTSATRLLYCTTGVLLRRLEGDADLKGVTHVIVDEVHERTEESDFLLLVLKDLMVQRPDLKIILMSATLNANLISEYFYNCPTVHIPGRTFPVDQFFLEDAIAKTGYIIEDGSPYMRSGKQHQSSTCGQTKGDPRCVVDDLGDDVWNFMSFCKKDFVKDEIPDQQLSLQYLTIRYKDTKKSVLKTMAAMDLDKINMDLVESLLEWIVEGKHNYPPGAVLVFLPGLAEIKMLYEQLQCNRKFNNRGASRCVVYPLHSTLSNEEQEAVFSHPPDGVTKIIISTNIAETSVTIDDVVYVIDSGKMKEKRYDASKSMESLEDTWISRANALQRKGRAGRVASGVCFHLFTSHCFKHQLAEQQLPEIQRVPLEQLCLRIKILDVFAEQMLESVFSRLIEPPPMGSLDAAKQRLQDLGALMADERLTPLGYHLACLPVDVRIGKLMLFGAIFRCLDPALTIAASLAFKSPFVSPWDKREEATERKRAFALANSDHLALLQAYKGFWSAAKHGYCAGFSYCRENFLSWRGLQEIASLKRQFAELLSDIGFIKEGLRARIIEHMSSKGTDGVLEATGPEANLNSKNIRLISAMLCAALYPNVVQVRAPQGNYKKTCKGAMMMQPKANELRFMIKNDGYVHIHPSSVNYMVRHYASPYLVYHEKVKTSRVFIRDCSMVSVYALVLFGCGQVNVELHKGDFLVSLDDGWIRFAAASHQVAELVKELRWELDRLLEDKIRNPSMDLCSCPRGSSIIRMIVHLISTE
ncbi:putative ATP-dependent RNA helicase DHX57 [Archocentrus centrarchus]|uniref:putative ATP-dependent RNA helicase DHX57 n=1 Tax=Archocentrus centrarchus TaxID=63155 RepID=UPI0011E9DCC1|nr:putative ATP-dependent RNA helicase DHX57 [Archocentrus centrarchus]XP_030575971.1 putative ATP-dependent RNA helicase DHX57 [Archocentrus centrarchus]XP_030575972.1 putative ATP-dependent RNA helicase DHX57 [Archocentrus centrarchus]